MSAGEPPERHPNVVYTALARGRARHHLRRVSHFRPQKRNKIATKRSGHWLAACCRQRRGRCHRRRSHGGRKRCSKTGTVSKPVALMNRKRPQHCSQRNSSRERCGGGGGSVDANPGMPVTWGMPLASLQCGQQSTAAAYVGGSCRGALQQRIFPRRGTHVLLLLGLWGAPIGKLHFVANSR
ncbi:hypothetical protein TraAM80_09541 [Trypanosoma rangeli]|uniref:Uncharacterized protein n=1 Tax=Trypanosoma rangeli TaxID=5698 RepID=A0A3R7MXY8_TRYRA|nr:uncharacterized protein TraAM80_09541 [Trypanosoma rangeli]RNE96998.1 hypothetical protein TraAM80_09541 [Trypanosoma rangeli]|eukprot:RNE96998.1 hypothetical protein TraAM80_09541 [Trypanosoma rangeli]